MDKPIDPILLRRKRRAVVLKVSIPAVLLAGFFLLLPGWIRPSLDRRNIQTAVVVRGPVEASISASGVVLPDSEQSISSPAETRLLGVRKRPGEAVKRGEPLLELDRSELALAAERTSKELLLKENQRTRLKLDMERALSDLKGQSAIKKLRGEYLGSKSEQSGRMFGLGAISKDQLDQALLEEKIAAIERRELEQSIRNTEQSMESQMEGLSAEVQTLRKEEADARRKLDLLMCRAGMDGVVTWVADRVGGSIHSGETVARVANLSSYRVEASIADIHATRLAAGMPARVRLKDAVLSGRVRTVYPTIENGVVTVSLTLDDPSNRLLRPSLRADVFLITGRKDDALKVKKGPFINGPGAQPVFIIRGNTAARVSAGIGVMSFDEVEISGPVAEGDEVITSDMAEYIHLAEIRIH